MSRLRRFVLDTNIIVSAAFFPGKLPGQVMEFATQQGRILASEMTFAEVTDVILRPRFDRFASLAEREDFLENFARNAEFVSIREAIVVCRDPKDDQYLELAVNGYADCLITGDEDLLVLHPFREIPILTARNFLETMTEG